jgi:F-type H+-transporting ATPase subunit a
MIRVALEPEYVLNVSGLKITNSFLTTVVVTVLLALLSFVFYTAQKKKQQNTEKENLVFAILRTVIYEILKFTDMVTRDRELSKKFLPLVATFFIFIITANLLELIPGFLGSIFVNVNQTETPLLRSPNSDLTTTLALAIVSVAAIQYFSIRTLGIKGYISKFINFKTPLMFIFGFFELLSEAVKVLSFSFRLFGNIFAGEVLLLIVAFLIPYLIPLPFMILEIFVGIVQAFIFAMLTLTFIRTSIMKHVASSQKT